MKRPLHVFLAAALLVANVCVFSKALDMSPGVVSRTVSVGGTGSQANPSGVFLTATPNTTTTGTANETVYTYNLPANTLDKVGRLIRITFVADSAANANSKRMILYLGPVGDNNSVPGTPSTGGAAAVHHGVIYILKTGANTQYFWGYIISPSNQYPSCFGVVTTYTDTGEIAINCNFWTATQAGDLTLKAVVAEVLN